MENIEYKELVQELVNEFKKSLPENENVMAEKFKEYLYVVIDKWQNETSKFLIRSREEIEAELRSITKRIAGYELEKKEEILIEDEKFMKIAKFSNNIYEIARDVLNGNQQPTEFENIKSELEEIIQLSEEVKSYNKDKAKELISESILDFNFVKNPNKGIMSMRLAQEERNKKNFLMGNIKEEER